MDTKSDEFSIEIGSFRISRADPSNLVIHRLRKDKDPLFVGYYGKLERALLKCFDLNISSGRLKNVAEVIEAIELAKKEIIEVVNKG